MMNYGLKFFALTLRIIANKRLTLYNLPASSPKRKKVCFFSLFCRWTLISIVPMDFCFRTYHTIN